MLTQPRLKCEQFNSLSLKSKPSAQVPWWSPLFGDYSSQCESFKKSEVSKLVPSSIIPGFWFCKTGIASTLVLNTISEGS